MVRLRNVQFQYVLQYHRLAADQHLRADFTVGSPVKAPQKQLRGSCGRASAMRGCAWRLWLAAARAGWQGRIGCAPRPPPAADEARARPCARRRRCPADTPDPCGPGCRSPGCHAGNRYSAKQQRRQSAQLYIFAYYVFVIDIQGFT